MNKKLKLALATLLGFSAACSTVKNAPAKGEGEQQQEAGAPEVRDSVAPPRVMVMYGVRPPGQKTIGVFSMMLPVVSFSLMRSPSLKGRM